jgi:hypothetical protein
MPGEGAWPSRARGLPERPRRDPEPHIHEEDACDGQAPEEVVEPVTDHDTDHDEVGEGLPAFGARSMTVMPMKELLQPENERALREREGHLTRRLSMRAARSDPQAWRVGRKSARSRSSPAL